METINKSHNLITHNRRISLAAYMKVEEKFLYFSAAAAMDYGIVAGLFMHFQNDGDKWYFYCNNDSDGFSITPKPGKNAVIVCDASLCTLIRKRTLVSLGSKFLVQLTNAKLNGQQLIEICFNKPIESE